jgi:hypothetical protein
MKGQKAGVREHVSGFRDRGIKYSSQEKEVRRQESEGRIQEAKDKIQKWNSELGKQYFILL